MVRERERERESENTVLSTQLDERLARLIHFLSFPLKKIHIFISTHRENRRKITFTFKGKTNFVFEIKRPRHSHLGPQNTPTASLQRRKIPLPQQVSCGQFTWDCRMHRLLLCKVVRHTPTNKCSLAKSPGRVEYTDCFSTEGKTPPTSVLDMTLNNLMVRLQ